MSFLNPVSEPVLMYSSTDANAPKINYAARAAGDVKTVLKACLVTGYGSKAGAGWSIQNETATVAEFVSPGVAMSDYSFGVTDTSASNTTWYYKYKGTQTNPAYNTPNKSFANINTTHADNGWRLIVSKRGMIFIELVQSTVVNKLSARLTYIGAVKSAVTDTNGINIAFFNIGHSAAISEPANFYSINYPHIRVESLNQLAIHSALPFLSDRGADLATNVSQVDIISHYYVSSAYDAIFAAELPGLVGKIVNDKEKIYGIANETLENRHVLKICLGYQDNRTQYMYSRGRVMLIYLDGWSY